MKKLFIVLLALLAVSPVFAQRNDIEVGANVGYANLQVPDLSPVLGVAPFEYSFSGIAFGIDAKYEIKDGINAFARFDFMGYTKMTEFYHNGDKISYKIKESIEDAESFGASLKISGIKLQAGAIYDFDLDLGVDGLSVGAGLAFDMTTITQSYKESLMNIEEKQTMRAFGIDFIAEVEYEIKDGISAFVDIMPGLQLGANGKISVEGETAKLKAHEDAEVVKFNFAAVAGARYAF